MQMFVACSILLRQLSGLTFNRLKLHHVSPEKSQKGASPLAARPIFWMLSDSENKVTLQVLKTQLRFCYKTFSLHFFTSFFTFAFRVR